MASARKPIASDSPSAITPRTIGSRSTRWRAIAESIGRETCAIEPALEALHPAARVHELLLARVEGVALRADLDVQLRLRRARLERVPAGARHRREDVLGMNVGLHRAARIAAASAAATFPPETIATTGSPLSSGTFPVRRAAVAGAPAASHASFARAYRNRKASAISASVTRTTSSTRRRTISSAFRPA